MLEEEPRRPRKQGWMGRALSGQWAPLQLALGPPDPPALLSCVSSEWGWGHGGIGWFTSPGGCTEESSGLPSFRATRRQFLLSVHEWTTQASPCPTSKPSKHSSTNQSVISKEWDPVAQMFVQNKTSHRVLGFIYFYMHSRGRTQCQRSSSGLWKERHKHVHP